jgi:hypothetical protein
MSGHKFKVGEFVQYLSREGASSPNGWCKNYTMVD